MNLIRATRQAIERRMSISDFDSVLDMIAPGGGAPSYTGKLVSPLNAMGISTVWRCVDNLAGDWATAPLQVFRWLVPGEAREEARDHYLWPVLMEEANPRMAAHRFKRVMETWRQLWGNAYAEVEISGRGQVVALWPWRPDRVSVWLKDPSDPRSDVYYTYRPMDQRAKPITVSADQMLHVRHVSMDGIMGLSPIAVHRQILGLNMAMTEHAGRFYSNGAVIKGILQHPGTLGPKGMKNLEESMEKYRGLENSHRMMILEEGMQYKEIGMPLEDAQFIQSMNMNGGDICRIYNMPPHKAQYLERSTNNNIEWQGREYVDYTLGPNSANWCGEIHCSLLSGRERDSVFVEPNFDHLTMGDLAARAAYYNVMTNSSAFSPDDIREREGYNPLSNGMGRLPRAPLNTVPLGSPSPVPASLPGARPNGKAPEAVQ